jgi:predicted dehydrogenase
MRGQQDMKSLLTVSGVELVMAADVYDDRLTRVKEILGEKIETTREYRQVLDRKDVDAVLVATHDPWHKPIVVEAMNQEKMFIAKSP